MASIAPESNRSKSKVPDPEPQDSTEVTSCLETARELWQNGQLKEAVRWVQRGADAAEQDGNDMRALSLARTAADLAAQAANATNGSNGAGPSVPVTGNVAVNATGPVNPSAPPEPSAIDVQFEPSSSSRGKQPPALPKVSPAELAANKPRESVSPAPISARDTAPGAVVPSSNSEARSSASKSSPRASTGSLRPTAQTGQLGQPGPRSATASERQTVRLPSSRAGAPSEPPAPVKGEVFATPEAVARWLESGTATRVSVKRSAAEPALYVVRPLAEAGKLPRGARRAVLIYLDENEIPK